MLIPRTSFLLRLVLDDLSPFVCITGHPISVSHHRAQIVELGGDYVFVAMAPHRASD